MAGLRVRTGWIREPLAILFLGLFTSILGVMSTYAFPSTRMSGLSPAVALQCVAIFGGIAVMLLGLELSYATTLQERQARLKGAVRYGIVFVALLSILAWLHVPFAVFIALMAATPLAERFRRVCAWLGEQ